MRRREFIALVGSTAAVWPLAARAQQPPPRMPEGQARFVFLREGLGQLGWVQGHNLQIESRWGAVGSDLVQRFTNEIVSLRPDVIFTAATPTTAAVLQRTRSIPLVFVLVINPVGAGFVASLSHPGGNATGFTNLEPTISTKWLELLKEVAPLTTRVALLFNPATAPSFEYYLNPFKAIAHSLGIEPVATPIHDKSEIEPVLAKHAQEPNGGLIVIPDTFLVTNRMQLVSLANQYRLPAIYFRRLFTDLGGLLSYGFDLHDQFRRAATYVDKIFNGEKPSDLPVQAPVKFEFVVNIKTAKALSLTVPDKLITIADEVIE